MTTFQKLGLIFAFNLIAFLLCFGGWLFAYWGVPLEEVPSLDRMAYYLLSCFILAGATGLALMTIREYESD